MLKTFYKKASILFVFGLIFSCSCGRDNLFADRQELIKEHKGMIEREFNKDFETVKKSGNKCDALKKLHDEYEIYMEMINYFEPKLKEKMEKEPKESYKYKILEDLHKSSLDHKEMLNGFKDKIDKETRSDCK